MTATATELTLKSISRPHLISVVLDDVEENGQASGPDVQLAGVDDARQLEQNREPTCNRRS